MLYAPEYDVSTIVAFVKLITEGEARVGGAEEEEELSSLTVALGFVEKLEVQEVPGEAEEEIQLEELVEVQEEVRGEVQGGVLEEVRGEEVQEEVVKEVQKEVLGKVQECEVCGKVFTSRRKLGDHVRAAHTDPENCALCGRLFVSKKQALAHQRRVHSNEHFECDSCDQSFTRKDSLVRHGKTCLAHRRRRRREEKGEKCTKCAQLFSCISSLRRHARKVHSQESQASGIRAKYLGWRQRKTWSCGHCGQVFSRRDRLKKHLAAKHRGPVLECGACEFNCTFLPSLKRHRRAVHRGERLWKCEVCENTFTLHEGLHQHMRGVHAAAGAATFACTRCGKEFRRRFHVRRHERWCGRRRPEVPWERLSSSGKRWRAGRMARRLRAQLRVLTGEERVLVLRALAKSSPEVLDSITSTPLTMEDVTQVSSISAPHNFTASLHCCISSASPTHLDNISPVHLSTASLHCISLCTFNSCCADHTGLPPV